MDNYVEKLHELFDNGQVISILYNGNMHPSYKVSVESIFKRSFSVRGKVRMESEANKNVFEVRLIPEEAAFYNYESIHNSIVFTNELINAIDVDFIDYDESENNHCITECRKVFSHKLKTPFKLPNASIFELKPNKDLVFDISNESIINTSSTNCI